jgi:hypothetical protein
LNVCVEHSTILSTTMRRQSFISMFALQSRL